MDAASALFTRFIIDELSRRDPALVPAEIARPDPVKSALLPAPVKRSVLEHAYAKAGPEAILMIGQGVKRQGFAPILHVLLASKSPAALAERWHRLERYGHSRHRTEVTSSADGSMAFRRWVESGPAPKPVESLLMCGWFIGLLEAIGCRETWCRTATDDGTSLLLYRSGDCFPDGAQGLGPVDRWAIGWRDFDPAAARSERTVAEPPVKTYADGDRPAWSGPVRAAAEAIARDLSQPWTLGDLAGEIGQSTRTLQRRLAEADLSFSRLVRAERISQACRLLDETAFSLTEIGYWCGFSDSAHFSRMFSASTGMAPSAYRQTLVTAE